MKKGINTTTTTKEGLEKQAKAILKMAEETGLTNNYFFVTTFERYQTQMEILEELKETIHNKDLVVSKEYVKGKENLYSNPAIVAYNRTTDSANKTVATLLRILKSFDAESAQNESDPLMDMLNGGDADDEQ